MFIHIVTGKQVTSLESWRSAGRWETAMRARGRLGEGGQKVGACVFSARLRISDFVARIFPRRFYTATLLSPFVNHTIPKMISSIGFMLKVEQFSTDYQEAV